MVVDTLAAAGPDGEGGAYDGLLMLLLMVPGVPALAIGALLVLTGVIRRARRRSPAPLPAPPPGGYPSYPPAPASRADGVGNGLIIAGAVFTGVGLVCAVLIGLLALD